MSDQKQGMGNTVPGSAPVPPPEPPSHRSRGGISAGIVFIVVGVVFLFAQFIPGILWWQMWPLIVVFAGGVQILTPDPKNGWGAVRIMDGVVTVIAGFVLLGNMTGHISWSVWWTVLMLWPVLLVAIGLAIIGRATEQTWLRAVAPVTIWIAFGYAVATSLTGAGGAQPVRSVVSPVGRAFEVSEPQRGITRASFVLNGGAGDIRIANTHGQLVSAKGKSPFGTPEVVVNREGTNADVRFGIGTKEKSFAESGFAAGSVDVGLSDSVLWDVMLQAGATNLVADFTHVRLDGLTIRTGASSVDVKLGEVPEVVDKGDVAVKAGVSAVKLRVPKEAAVRVVARDGLSAIDVSGSFVHQADGSWETPGFESASNVYEIRVESGVGSVSIAQE